MLERCTPNAARVLLAARDAAIEWRHREIAPEHVLLALLEQDDSTAIACLERAGVDVALCRQELHRGLVRGTEASLADPSPLSGPIAPATKRVLEHALTEAAAAPALVGTEHFLLALFRAETAVVPEALRAAGATARGIRSALAAVRRRDG